MLAPLAAAIIQFRFPSCGGLSLPISLLEPLPYHREVVEYLKKREAELWQWSASADVLESLMQTARKYRLYT